MKRSSAYFIVILFVSVILYGCGDGGSGGDGPTAFGGILAMSMNESPGQDTDATYKEDYDFGSAAGANGAQIIVPWSVFENPPGTFNTSFVDNAGYGLNPLAARGLTILFTFSSIGVSNRTVPSDLVGVPFNSSTMKARYRNAIDHLLPYLNGNVIYLSVGNEVDTYLSANPGEWAAYREFIEDAYSYLHQVRPGIKVGVTTTFGGASGAAKAEVADLNTMSELFVLTYYGTGTQFQVEDPSAVKSNIAEMVSLANGRPVVIQEIGYPGAASLNSSEQKQADFVANVFQAWLAQGAAKIPFVSFFKMKEWTPAHCATVSSGGAPGEPFYDFLCSLGLRNNDYTPKLAWQSVLDGAASAGLR
ncbi:MAG TPA: hypothetical protein VFG95_00935 [Nitrospiria bacterium]|nr:hypothetical protein [Nitrospiria bacterium]